MGKIKETKAQSRMQTSDYELGRPVPWFLRLLLVQGKILIPFFLYSQSIPQDETQSVNP